MKQNWIENMKTRKRLKLSFKDWLIHYNIALFILFILILPIIDLIEYHITETYDGVRNPNEIFPEILIFLIPIIAIYFFQRNKLRLKEFNAKFNETQFNLALRKTVAEKKWHFRIKEIEFNRLYTDKDGEGEYGGDMVTIIRLNNRILINSIDDISINSSFFQSKRNRRNIMTFIKNLDEIIRIKK